MDSLTEAIVMNEGCTVEEALGVIEEMKARVFRGEDPEEVLYEQGYKPDYVFDLIYNLI